MASETWTIGKLINWARGYLAQRELDSPRLTAELLLAHALGLERMDLYLRFDKPLNQNELADFKALLLRRREHEPVAYIIGQKEFWGLELKVGPGVLVPRPETEHLVEQALERLRILERSRVLDLCTGSGAVALALAAELPEARVTATDLSPQALEFARRNANNLELAQRVEFLEGDLFAPVAARGGFFDLITANPPYVTEAEWDGLAPELSGFEPRQALVSGPGGLEVSENIIKGAPAHLRSGGWLMLELGQGQARAAMGLARSSGAYEEINTAKDLAGIERVLICQRKDYG